MAPVTLSANFSFERSPSACVVRKRQGRRRGSRLWNRRWDTAPDGTDRRVQGQWQGTEHEHTVWRHMPLLKGWENSIQGKARLLLSGGTKIGLRRMRGKAAFLFGALCDIQLAVVSCDAQRQSVAANSADYFSFLRLPLNMITVKLSRLKACSIYDKMWIKTDKEIRTLF